MATPDKPSAHEPSRPALRADWCRCPDWCADPISMPDRLCPCGVDKHHYHCTACLGINQVG